MELLASKYFLCLFTGILLLLSSSALGQDDDYPKTEFFGGFSYLNADLITRQNFFGWQVSISDNFHKNVGIAVEELRVWCSHEPPLLDGLGQGTAAHRP